MFEDILRKIYYDLNSPGAYGGAEKLYRESKKSINNITRKDVKNWLSSQLTYTLHKKARRRFKRNPVVAENINENFQADLVDLKEFSKSNNNFNYILTVIDVFSKKAWAVPVKSKTASEVTEAMERILKNVVPLKLQTDKGKEFENSSFKSLMKKYNINFFTTNNFDIKCSVIERFNRTLKDKMFKYFTKSGGRKYIDILDSLIASYNNSYHRSIKMSPNEVNEHNKTAVFQNLYKVHNKRELLRNYIKPSLKIGDVVRQKYRLGPLDRGYYPNWTDQTFTINKMVKNFPKPLYRLTDSKDNLISKRYYPEEIQVIKNNSIYRVEKILAEKYLKREKYYKIKWLNYPESENSWIKAKDLLRI